MNMRIDETRLNQLLQNIKHDGQQQQVQQTNINMTNKTEGNAKHLNLLDIELYMMNDPYSEKGIKNLLQKSPIGLGDAPTKQDIEKMGYNFKMTAFHIGAPVTYESPDGGTITVYDGKGDANMGEDQRKIIYKKGNLVQTMYYDNNGKLRAGNITVRSAITNSKECYADFKVRNNDIAGVITGPFIKM